MNSIAKNMSANLVFIGIVFFAISILNSLEFLMEWFGIEFGASVGFTFSTLGITLLLSGIYGFIKVAEDSSKEKEKPVQTDTQIDFKNLSSSQKIQLSCVAFIILYPAFLMIFFDLKNQLSWFENFAFGIGVIIPLFGFWYARKISNK